MDKIWYRNPLKSEAIGRCVGGLKNRMTTQNRQKSNAKKKKIIHNYTLWLCETLNWINQTLDEELGTQDFY